MKLLPLALLVCLASCTLAPAGEREDRVRAYLALRGIDYADAVASRDALVIPTAGGEDAILVWNEAALGARPDDSELPPASALPGASAHLAAVRLAAENAAKPEARKLAENRYLELVSVVLLASGDSRKDFSPVPRLGPGELVSLIDSMRSSDPSSAIERRLELLVLDSELSKYSRRWWESAAYHPGVSE